MWLATYKCAEKGKEVKREQAHVGRPCEHSEI